MMTLKSQIKILALASIAFFSFTSCSDDDDAPGQADNNIVVTAEADSELTIFTQALDLTDLDDVLINANVEYTVLAPTNSAFEGISITDLETSTLRQLLLNHVIVGRLSSSDLTANGSGYATTESTAGPADSKISIYYDTSSGVRFNDTATVSDADIPATNGVIHKVDNIISLPTLATFVAADSNLSSLETALTSTALIGAFDDDDDTPGIDGVSEPFTIFAPNDAAFQALLDSNTEWNTLADIPAATVTAALELHVLEDANVRAEDIATLVDGDAITLGGILNINASTLVITGPANQSTIISGSTNIQTTNGVIHGIDTVLLPSM